MDNGNASSRKFPAYSLQHLKASAERGVTDVPDANTIDMIKQEIARRENGSQELKVPQVGW